LGLETNGGDSLVQSTDGLPTGSVGGWHWKYARLLLHWVSPDPARDGMVFQWYIATTAYMFSQRQWGFVELNLQLAQKYYPTDPIILFYAGVFHEIRAASKSQNALYPYPRSFYFDSKEEELKLALKFFQQAVRAEPKFGEAHLHLGRVMGLLGKHEDAAAELRLAAEPLLDPQLQYYCSLFLGYEFMMLDRLDEARAQFEHAKALFPDAQSPLLGLSRLAQRNGDMQNAFLAAQELFKLSGHDSIGDDPWWSYDVSHARNVSTLLSEMRKEFGGLLR
jgi:tetratricopeptide (TPR) repeat protein